MGTFVDPALRLSRRLVPGPDGCLDFTGYLGWYGYGRIYVDGRMQPASRVAWTLAHGPIPDGLLVCHKCDRPSCCNVDHLFLGTYQDNYDDMVEKKRRRSLAGEAHPRAAVTAAQVEEMRRRHAVGDISARELAAEFGVSRGNVNAVVSGRTWVAAAEPGWTPTKRVHYAPTKLTASAVREIRQRYAAGGVSYRALATEYGVAFSNIKAIVRRETWADLPD